jgi:hypothetical protein
MKKLIAVPALLAVAASLVGAGAAMKNPVRFADIYGHHRERWRSVSERINRSPSRPHRSGVEDAS